MDYTLLFYRGVAVLLILVLAATLARLGMLYAVRAWRRSMNQLDADRRAYELRNVVSFVVRVRR